MGQNTRPKGISFSHEMWTWIDERCRALKIGRSQYFQLVVAREMQFMPEIHAHKSDGKWHFFPEGGIEASGALAQKAAEPAQPPFPRPPKAGARRGPK
jgi:hypothetical protein